jgi:hypothetical protein
LKSALGHAAPWGRRGNVPRNRMNTIATQSQLQYLD